MGGNTVLAIVALTVANIGIAPCCRCSGACRPRCWRHTAAAGIALINSVGNLAGFVSPYLVGWLKDMTGTTNTGLYMLAACLVVGALVALAQPAKLVNK